MRYCCIYIGLLLFCLIGKDAVAQQFQGLAFTRIGTEDGSGLASNDVRSLYQDARGYIWVGTANGLQRFDGNKFILINSNKPGYDRLPFASVSQIISIDSTFLLIAFHGLREFGILNTMDLSYHKLRMKNKNPIPPRSEFYVWKDGIDIYMNVSRYAIMRLNKLELAFVEDKRIPLPQGWKPLFNGLYNDTILKQIWIPCDSGLTVYDKTSGTCWNRDLNPKGLALLNNERVQDGMTQIFRDKQKRFWISGWPKWYGYGHEQFCMDSSGSRYLDADTAGLKTGPIGYHEFHHFFESDRNGFWAYGSDVLFSYDYTQKRFNYIKSRTDQISINYETVFQLMEDRDGTLWFATDRGLYATSASNDSAFIANIIFSSQTSPTSITDILEMPNGDIWLTSWGTGIKVIDRLMRVVKHDVYNTPVPSDWPQETKDNKNLTWALCLESKTGEVWIGCNGGVLMIFNPLTKKTRYLQPPACNKSTIRFITEDKQGRIWLGTQSGKLIRYSNGQFDVIQEIGSIIYKVFVDRDGWLWLATHQKGLYAIDSNTGKMIRHYTTESEHGKLFNNTGGDIEQLNDSIIVYGAGALNFINKKNGKVTWLTYEDGLPSNNVDRLRMDPKGYLWIITSNGLCRFNPSSKHITPYGRKDGIVIAEQAKTADYFTANGRLIFGGGNNLLMFDPDFFSNAIAPPDVTITDFKISNQFLTVDSLLNQPVVKLYHNQNSISIYFASLSYRQRDKLNYYYKLEGIDENWVKADLGMFANYTLLPPGKYTFKVYCENIDGLRSEKITSIYVVIRPPFWRTGWFISSLVFVILLIVYDLHNVRVKRLLAVEKLRNKVARDLHDDMGSTLSTINILASMAKTKMGTDIVKTSEYLGKISDNSQRMMEAMDDIVWSIKPSNDSMQRITARMREFAINTLEAKDIELEFHVDEHLYDEKLDMEKRRDFFLVFKEAINNAAKYSHASHVFVDVSIKNRKIVLTVRDNGIGFERAQSTSQFGGNGLGNMKKRAESMNGTLTISSATGKGTEVTCKVPVV